MDLKLDHGAWTMDELEQRARVRYLVSFARTFCTNFFEARDELDKSHPVFRTCDEHGELDYDSWIECELCQSEHVPVDACATCKGLHDEYVSGLRAWRERVRDLHRRALELISARWPELSEECQRQAEGPIPAPVQF